MAWPDYSPIPGLEPTARKLLSDILRRASLLGLIEDPLFAEGINSRWSVILAHAALCREQDDANHPARHVHGAHAGKTDAQLYADVQSAWTHAGFVAGMEDLDACINELDHMGVVAPPAPPMPLSRRVKGGKRKKK